MNIFFVDENPAYAAKALCDKHVVKMALETAQILSTVFGGRYKPTHQHHPSVLWTRQEPEWVAQHFIALLDEYNFRYGRIHKSSAILDDLPGKLRTPFTRPPATLPPLCMPEEYRQADPVQAYRAYYRGDKARFARWDRGRSRPDWFALPQP